MNVAEGNVAMLIGHIDIKKLMIMCNRLSKISRKVEMSFQISEIRQGMSPDNIRAMPNGHLSNRIKRDMFHHLLVPLYEGTYVTSKIRIHNISMLDIQILKVVQDKGVIRLLHV